jgi:aryl-alcohol dehydrogenase-like predicted oxidoreductase
VLTSQEVLEDVISAFRQLQADGKVRFYGITGLGDTEALFEVINSTLLHTVQVCYNLLNPSAGHPVPQGFPSQDFRLLIDRATAQGMGSIGIRVLAAGALSGQEARHPIAVPSVEPIASGPDYRTDVERARDLDFLVEERYANNLVEAAMRFAWNKTNLSTALVGVSSLEHLEQAIAAQAQGALPASALVRLTQAWRQFAAA